METKHIIALIMFMPWAPLACWAHCCRNACATRPFSFSFSARWGRMDVNFLGEYWFLREIPFVKSGDLVVRIF
jgi:hypothetical protein